jgi:hypothetical protein
MEESNSGDSFGKTFIPSLIAVIIFLAFISTMHLKMPPSSLTIIFIFIYICLGVLLAYLRIPVSLNMLVSVFTTMVLGAFGTVQIIAASISVENIISVTIILAVYCAVAIPSVLFGHALVTKPRNRGSM